MNKQNKLTKQISIPIITVKNVSDFDELMSELTSHEYEPCKFIVTFLISIV